MPRMHSPSHPGQILEELYIKPHRLTITEVAGALGIARKNLYAVIKGEYAVSVEMAFKLSKLLGTTPDFWLQAQMNYDLAKGYEKMEDIEGDSLTGILICKAIKKKLLIQFEYNGKLRTAEPQCYGVGTKGTALLRAYQVNDPRVEKLFDVDKMANLVVLESHFKAAGPNYKERDSAMKKIFCELD